MQGQHGVATGIYTTLKVLKLRFRGWGGQGAGEASMLVAEGPVAALAALAQTLHAQSTTLPYVHECHQKHVSLPASKVQNAPFTPQPLPECIRLMSFPCLRRA